MKYVAILVLLLGFTVPVMAEEGTADGKGIYCPTVWSCQGYWFENGAATCFLIVEFEVYESVGIFTIEFIIKLISFLILKSIVFL